MPRMDRTAAPPMVARRPGLLGWAVLGGVGWLGLLQLGATMLAQHPPQAGFDLQLILDAARRVAGGGSPYDPAAVAGRLQASDLFYSYPPPLAQALAPVAGLPSGAALALWGVGATAGLGLVAVLLARRLAPGRPAPAVLLPLLALAPFVSPFAVALLFGNVDAWFGLLYGLVLLAALAEAGGAGRATLIGGGVALGLASVIKVHPAVLGLWFLVRALRGRGPAWTVLGAAVVTAAAVLGGSLAAFGTGPWADYVAMLRTSSGADLASRLNIGPASQLALLLGSPAVARPLAVVVAAVAVAVTVAAAWLRADPLESLAWAAVASLAVLPVTWFHYPVALIPFGVAAWLLATGGRRALAVQVVLGLAVLAAIVSIVAPVLVWLAVGLVLAAIAGGARAAVHAEFAR